MGGMPNRPSRMLRFRAGHFSITKEFCARGMRWNLGKLKSFGRYIHNLRRGAVHVRA